LLEDGIARQFAGPHIRAGVSIPADDCVQMAEHCVAIRLIVGGNGARKTRPGHNDEKENLASHTPQVVAHARRMIDPKNPEIGGHSES
jgi:hypothetical protein